MSLRGSEAISISKAPAYAIVPKWAATSTMRFEKPHSLSYHDRTRTKRLSSTWVCVTSKVELWGSVVEHEDGYRASHARITELWVDDAQVARWVALTYPEARVWLGSPPGEILVPPS